VGLSSPPAHAARIPAKTAAASAKTIRNRIRDIILLRSII
jgi:hypothetical protein